MADRVREHTTIEASEEECFAVLLDFERYPEWAKDLKAVEVLERDDEGRGTLVRYRAAAMGRSTTYTLRYDHADPHRLAWELTEGDVTRMLDGHYEFAEAEGGGVEVTYELAVELILPLPGFVKRRTQARIMHTALRDLKDRVEAGNAQQDEVG